MKNPAQLALIALTLLITALLFYILLEPSSTIEKDASRQSPLAKSTPINSFVASQQATFKPIEAIKKAPNALYSVPASTPSISEKDHIIEKVRDASTTYDPASLPIIEPYLYSPDSEIRGEAVNAIVNLGDKAGAVLLRKYAEKESNLERKLEILKLADWLELPSGKIPFTKKKSEKPKS
jgi:HEAT repeat protein